MYKHLLIAAACVLATASMGTCQGQGDAPLPPGARAVWDLESAYREASPTRERVSVNGLWRWQPADAKAEQLPAGNWGYFKVPGAWPGITDWIQKDCQTVHAHPSWKDADMRALSAAWYQREMSIPPEWAGRRILLAAEYLNSFATVYVDGKKVGEMRFPAGEVDLTAACRPGGKHVVSLHVVAMPLKAVMLSFGATNSAKEIKGLVKRRGLCGDVSLVGEPAGARISDPRVQTSVRSDEVTLVAGVQGLAPDGQYALQARIGDNGAQVAEFTSKPFRAADLKDGRFTFTEKWKPAKLWDTHTPQNQYQATFSLVDAGGKALDVAHPVRFGFRELWIQGRDFYLNGTRIFLCAMPLDNAQIGAAWATYEGAKESLLRMKSIGINFVYTHNYGCEPGTHLGFAEVLRAADDVGMLVSFSQPHFAQYDWQAADADQTNGYVRDAAFYVRAAGSHPSVVCYSTSHNATGYSDDMNPDMLDGTVNLRQAWAQNNANRALHAEELLKRLDPSRFTYHHSSGNLGTMHTSNFYTNFAPIQELDDWFEQWAAKGTKPLFTCEYMVPCTYDFTMYRGWYKGVRSFGENPVPWEFCSAEWNSQFLGDRAFRIPETEKANLRFEAARFREGKLWHRWDYPNQVGSRAFPDQHEVVGKYMAANWRAFRTWGVSAISPWEYSFYWTPREGADRSFRELKTDWNRLQRPGFSPDYIRYRFERHELAFERDDWIPTADGQAILRNNMPLLAYIGGKPASVTSKDHNFTPGESVEKQIVIINNSRETVTADCRWSLAPPGPPNPGGDGWSGGKTVAVPTGQQERIPLRFALPAALAPGKYDLTATVRFSSGETQSDTFAIHVLPKPAAPAAGGRIALFDTAGETGKMLAGMGVRCQPVQATTDLSAYDVLVVGKRALTLDGPAPDIRRVRDGLKVVLFEQTPDVLEKRFGFRVAEYGLRDVFKRVSDHPVLAGLENDSLRDWRGEATTVGPRLKYEKSARFGSVPVTKWCDIEVPRVWRCGNRGSVATALIEKPARGDFLPLVDGGFSLQYSPLMEYREGKGVVLFCQMEVTGRSERDPAAETLAANLMRYVSAWKPAPRRSVLYAGDPAGRRHLERAGIAVTPFEGGKLSPEQVLVIGAGRESAGSPVPAGQAAAIAEFVKAGGHVLALGLNEQQANAFLPAKVQMKPGEHIATFFQPLGVGSLLEGVGPADAHNRDPRALPLVAGGAVAAGNGVLARANGANVVFCQLPPYTVSKAEGAVPTSIVTAEDAAEGKQSALVTMGSVSGLGARVGQKVAAGTMGKTYTFAAMVKPLGEAVTARLEIERPAKVTGQVAKGENVLLPEGQWTELHVTFRAPEAAAEGWALYLTCAQEGARLRADQFRLYEGEYVAGAPAAANLITNPGFEDGVAGWQFTFHEQHNLRRTYRRTSFTLSRLLGNMGAGGATPVLERFSSPVKAATEKRWQDGLYLDQPTEWDEPYRFFRW